MERCILVHYHEIGLKGRNRGRFEAQLGRNLERALRDLPAGPVRRLSGRLAVPLLERAGEDEAVHRLAWIPGVAYLAPAWRVPSSMPALREGALLLLEEEGLHPASFAIRPRRADKSFPHDSQEIGRILGAAVQERWGWPVDLSHPELELTVEVLPREAYLYTRRHRGCGGLPVGTGGRVLALLSGGIDSPVAAFQMMKRGCQVDLVHFHSVPHTSPRSKEKAVELARLLARVQGRVDLYLVAFGEVQGQLVLHTPPPYRVILYRRFMARIAQALARQGGAGALVTGESLGQVASQTLHNLAAIEEAVEVPVLRPLIGLDKEEIVERARRLGTYEISILPYQDCCSLFVPRHPVTRSRLEDIGRIEAEIPVEELVERGLQEVELHHLRFPAAEAAEAPPAGPPARA